MGAIAFPQLLGNATECQVLESGALHSQVSAKRGQSWAEGAGYSRRCLAITRRFMLTIEDQT
jgi:hypothetical protein